MNLDPSEFKEFCSFLKDSAGIDLAENKQYLVTTRIRRTLAEFEIESFGELVKRVKQISEKQLRQRVIDAMTTNETFWFRDTYPFDYLKTHIFPEFSKGASSSARIWSAACSSGQEPYSISMIADEYKRSGLGSRFKVDILATDLSSKVLEQAKSGEYDQLSISRGMSEQRLKRFFSSSSDKRWRIRPEIQECVQFRPINLKDSYAILGKFDIVFCRNVLIYFSAELKEDILRRIHASMKPGGHLFLGSSESLGGAAELFQMVHCNPGVVYVAK